MGFLRLLAAGRTAVLDGFFSGLTYFGSELAFMAAALLMFWCIDKRQGYYVFLVGAFGTICNQFLKLAFRIPRPWVLDPEFQIVESARAGATGYSFPSGHTQNIVGTTASLFACRKEKWVRIVCAVLMVLVPFSRMYLGVHTPLDVGVSLGIGLVLMFVLYPFFRDMDEKPKRIYALFAAFIVLAGTFVAFVELYSFPADLDMGNYESGLKNAYMILFCAVGLLLVFHLDRKYISFPTEAVWWAQIIKVAVGLGVTVGIKAALKAPLLALFGGHSVAHGVRYFIVILFAGLIWPLTFKFFAKLGKNN